jgi:exodeoxyribonuclease VII small subunit
MPSSRGASPLSLSSMAKAPSSKTTLPPLPETYELALQELEQLVGTIESGAMPLDELLSAYQRGAQLLAFCRARLDAVDRQVRLLDGTPVSADEEEAGDA